MQPRGDQIVFGPGRKAGGGWDPIRSKREEAKIPILKFGFVTPVHGDIIC